MNEIKTRKEWNLSRALHGRGRNCSIFVGAGCRNDLAGTVTT